VALPESWQMRYTLPASPLASGPVVEARRLELGDHFAAALAVAAGFLHKWRRNVGTDAITKLLESSTSLISFFVFADK